MCSLDQKSLPMESEDHSIDPRIRGIAENRNVLLEALDVNQILLTELSGDEVLDECTKQRITSEKNYGINERFIDWLERSSSQTIDVVLQKLRQDKQHHVANLIDGTEGERPLSAKVKLRIRKLSGWLTKNMTTDHGLIDQLFSRGAISSRDCEYIKAKPTESARGMELIDVILRRSDRTMKIFQEALTDSNQHHIAQVVEKESSGLKESCLELSDNKNEAQTLISCEQGQAVNSTDLMFDVEKRSHEGNEDPGKDKRVDLWKTEDIKSTEKSHDIKMELRENIYTERQEAEQEKLDFQAGLTVDDGSSKESPDPLIRELQLKLKLAEKERDRKFSENARLRERLRQEEEEKNAINEDLDELLKLDTEKKGGLIIELKQRVRQVEKENHKISKDLKETLFAQKTEKEHTGLKERHSERSFDLLNINFLDFMKETNTDAYEGAIWPGLHRLFDFAGTAITLNRQCMVSICLLILRNSKSRKEAIPGIIIISLWMLPLLLHLPVGIPDTISSFCLTNISCFYWVCLIIIKILIILIVDRRSVVALLGVGLLVLRYLSSGGFGPGVGVGRYCQEDKCVYLFCWEYLSNNMRIGNEAVEQINYNEAGGLFKSQAAFAVWNKYTSDRWDKEIREYTRDGRLIRKLHTKPLLGTESFHMVTVFRLSTGLVSAGHGSIFYDDPMLRLCLLDANGNIIKSFGGQYGQSKGVPAILDGEREGCIIVADQMSGRRMALCSDKDRMKQLEAKGHELNSPFKMCLDSQPFD